MQFSIATLSRSIIDTTLELVYPRICLTCGERLGASGKMSLCRACCDAIEKNDPPFCRGCGKSIVHARETDYCPSCEKTPHHLDRSFSVAKYDGIMRECVHKFKYNGKLSLETLFADMLASFAEKYIDITEIDCVVSVPLHRVKLRERTFNQAAVLASSLARRLDLPCSNDNLIRTSSSKPQIKLSKTARMKDIEGSFKVKRPESIKDRSILLVDDVFTTGATANECARVLKESGVRSVTALTLARGALGI